jgi:hypothetical protein
LAGKEASLRTCGMRVGVDKSLLEATDLFAYLPCLNPPGRVARCWGCWVAGGREEGEGEQWNKGLQLLVVSTSLSLTHASSLR